MSRPSEISSQTVLLSSRLSRDWSTARDLYRVAEAQRARVGLFLTRDHAGQRGLARAVRADDADDAARRQLKAQVVDQQLVAEALLEVLDLEHHIAEPRTRRNVDLIGFVALLV